MLPAIIQSKRVSSVALLSRAHIKASRVRRRKMPHCSTLANWFQQGPLELLACLWSLFETGLSVCLATGSQGSGHVVVSLSRFGFFVVHCSCCFVVVRDFAVVVDDVVSSVGHCGDDRESGVF